MTSNLYKVGDWVYCELSPYQPYVIRKIEELTKTSCGNVEAKVICAFRKQDIPAAIMATVEKYQQRNEQKSEKQQQSTNESGNESSGGGTGGSSANSGSNDKQSNNQTCDYDESEVNDLNDLQRYNLKHRELYFSKYTDTIAATTIRSKCSVLLFNEEVERYSDYVTKDDSFFYHLTYDPYQKSIVADKGEIRVGMRYQAEIPQLRPMINGVYIEDPNETPITSVQPIQNDRVLRSQLQKMANQKDQNREQLPEIPIAAQSEEFQWCPISGSVLNYNNQLTDREIDQFIILAKSVGTYARALDCTTVFKQPSLTLSAANASRDITAFHAMNVLHENNYNVGKAALSLITQAGPVLCRDEMEEWSVSEANLFEEALDKFGKEFNDIRKEILPWKTMKSIIEYYYTWKTTDRYVQQKRIKLNEQESKLKQVYIPNHAKQNQSALIKSFHTQLFQQYNVHLKSSCESCGTPTSPTNQWYAYNPTNLVQLILSGNQNPATLSAAAASHIASMNQNGITNANPNVIQQARVCGNCWIYWKKHGSFKYPNARQERLNQLKNQIHKCSVNGCGREFKSKQLLVKHCGIAHGYFAKTNNPAGPNSPRPPAMRNRPAFYLYTTPMTKAARLVCTTAIKLKKLSRRPFKLVDLAELNKEWSKETRNISNLLDELKKKTFIKRRLTKQLISVIFKSRTKSLKQQKNKLNESKQNGKKSTNADELMNGTNGHAESESHTADSDDDHDDDLVIDNDNLSNEDKPEFLKYFENKHTTPCFTPENLAFPKPSYDQINKFHLNLMSQNRKRTHDQVGATTNSSNDTNNSTKQTSVIDAGSNESSPLSKRTLLNNQHSQLNNLNKTLQNQASLNQTKSQTQQPQQQQQHHQQKQITRIPQKSLKPSQSVNLPNSNQEIYFAAIRSLKGIRRQVETIYLRKLARRPFKHLSKEYNQLYQTFSKLQTESLAKLTPAQAKDTTNNTETTIKLENTTNSTNIKHETVTDSSNEDLIEIDKDEKSDEIKKLNGVKEETNLDDSKSNLNIKSEEKNGGSDHDVNMNTDDEEKPKVKNEDADDAESKPKENDKENEEIEENLVAESIEKNKKVESKMDVESKSPKQISDTNSIVVLD